MQQLIIIHWKRANERAHSVRFHIFSSTKRFHVRLNGIKKMIFNRSKISWLRKVSRLAYLCPLLCNWFLFHSECEIITVPFCRYQWLNSCMCDYVKVANGRILFSQNFNSIKPKSVKDSFFQIFHTNASIKCNHYFTENVKVINWVIAFGLFMISLSIAPMIFVSSMLIL